MALTYACFYYFCRFICDDHWIHQDLAFVQTVYSDFLARYPYCHGYWLKWSEHKRKSNVTNGLNEAKDVMEAAVKVFPRSVELWLHYVTLYEEIMATMDENASESSCKKDDVIALYERALSYCGDNLIEASPLWTKFLGRLRKCAPTWKILECYQSLLKTPLLDKEDHFNSFQRFVQIDAAAEGHSLFDEETLMTTTKSVCAKSSIELSRRRVFEDKASLVSVLDTSTCARCVRLYT